MASRSTGQRLIRIGVAVLVLPVVLYGIVFLLALGPLAWIALGVVFVSAGIALKGDGADRSADGPTKTNCPACGARTDADRGTCSYCEEPL